MITAFKTFPTLQLSVSTVIFYIICFLLFIGNIYFFQTYIINPSAAKAAMVELKQGLTVRVNKQHTFTTLEKTLLKLEHPSNLNVQITCYPVLCDVTFFEHNKKTLAEANYGKKAKAVFESLIPKKSAN